MNILKINQPLVSSGDTLGESPLWDNRRSTFFWVDIDRGLIHSVNPLDLSNSTYDFGEKIGTIAMHENGGFLLAGESGLWLWNPEENQKSLLLAVKHEHPDNLFNDGKVDPLHRFWIGTKGPKGTSKLWVLKDGKLTVKLNGLSISNGLDWPSDGKFFYHTDSMDHAIYRYDFDMETATLTNRTDFFKPGKGTPDGLTLDIDGNIWTAIWDGWQVLQLSPTGEVLTEIKLPVQRPTSVAFGGTDLRTLFITSASEGLLDEEKEKQPHAGDLFALQPGTAGRNANIIKT